MKTIYALSILLVSLVINAAVPDYKAFRGIGGITVTSNPPNGTIVIDGSGISAGALPAYGITNNWNGPTFTNRVGFLQVGNQTNSGKIIVNTSLDSGSDEMLVNIESTDADQANRINMFRIAHVDQTDPQVAYGVFISDSGGAPTEDYKFGQTDFTTGAGIPVTFLSSLAVSGPVTNSGALRQVGAATFISSIFGTNGDVTLGNAGHIIKFGETVDNFGTFSNHFIMESPGPINLRTPGIGLSVFDTAVINVENGAQISIGVNGAFGTTASKIQFGTNDYIVSLGTTDNLEIQRYRFYNDNSGNSSNLVQRQWEVVNIASNAVRIAQGANVTVTPSGSGGIMTYTIAATGGSGTPAGNNFEIQYNDGGVFAASTNILVSTNKSIPQVIVGTPAMSSTVGGFEVRGITHTNRVTQHGVSAVDNTLALGISNFAYQVTFEIEDGRLNLAASVGGGLGSTIKDNWSFIQATNLYADSSIHTPGTTTSAQFETTNATPGSATAAITIRSTNLTQSVRVQGAHQMTRDTTNIIGILEVATNDIASAVFTIDCNKQHEVNMTNRIGFAFTTMVTNGVPGQRIKGRFIGTASGGANHIVTFAGQGLFLNSYDISVAPATSLAVTVTNGYLLEYDIAINKDNGTNTFDTIYAYKKY